MYGLVGINNLYVFIFRPPAHMTQSPWTFSAAPMELPITRPLNSSSSETSIDSGFETPTSTSVAMTACVNGLIVEENDALLAEAVMTKSIHNAGSGAITDMLV